MIKACQYNRNIDICDLTTKIIKESKGSMKIIYQGNQGDWFSSEEECYEAGQVPVHSIEVEMK